MWHGDNSQEIASQRLGSLLVSTLSAAAILLGSVINGAAVALDLEGPPPSLDYGPMHTDRRAETQAPPQSEALGNATTLVASHPRPAAQRKGPTSVGLAFVPAADNAVAPMPVPASSSSPPIAERELTFAWGYTRRHPTAQPGYQEARVTPAVARPQRQAVERTGNSEAHLGSERRRISGLGFQAPRVFAQLDAAPHQPLAYTEPETTRRGAHAAVERRVRKGPDTPPQSSASRSLRLAGKEREHL